MIAYECRWCTWEELRADEDTPRAQCPECAGYVQRSARQPDPAPERKPSNPKDRVGVTKVPLLSVLSWRVLGEVALGMLEGALKYGRHNYRAVGVRASVYGDAALRHLTAWWEGQDIDPASGLNHVTKTISCLMVLRDSMLQGNWTDDRPPRVAEENWVDEQSAATKELLLKYPEPEEPWTQARVDEED